MNHRALALLAILLFLSIAACSDSSTAPSPKTTGTVAGIVTEVGTNQPLTGTTILLVTNEFAIVQAANVGPDGAFFFDNVPAGSMLLYAFKANYRMAEASVSRVVLQNGQDWTMTVQMLEDADLLLDHRIEGRVTDADTGSPVAGVWIAYIGLGEAGNSVRYLVENSGTSLTISDEEGYYSLAAYGVTEYWQGPVIGLGPISCGREGYRSRTFAGEGPDSAYEDYLPGGLLPAPADSVLVLDIELEPTPAGGLPSTETGTVRGTILYDGQPKEGVMVNLTLMALAERDTVFDPTSKVAVDGGFVLSGEDGSYELRVEPGFYAIRAGLLPDDGWLSASGSLVEIIADEVVEMSPISMNLAITPLSPQPGSLVPNQQVTLSWTPIDGAEFYTIKASINSVYSYDTFHLGNTTEPEFSWTVPAPEIGQFNLIRWKVYATCTVEGDIQQRFSWFEVPATFTVGAESE